MKDLFFVLVFVWVTLTLFGVRGVINEKSEECSGLVKIEYVADLMEGAFYWPMALVINWDVVEPKEKDKCEMVIPFETLEE